MIKLYKRGFTLIELLIVIAIIGILTAIIILGLGPAREKAKVSWTVSEIHQLRNAALLYLDDTGRFPLPCGYHTNISATSNNCTEDSDPFLHPLGVPGWRGPYFRDGFWNFKHPWGGHFSVQARDITGSPAQELIIFLDEDAPYYGPPSIPDSRNARIPTRALLEIDRIYDDGNLGTGDARGNPVGGPGDPVNENPPIEDPWHNKRGEMVVILRP